MRNVNLYVTGPSVLKTVQYPSIVILEASAIHVMKSARMDARVQRIGLACLDVILVTKYSMTRAKHTLTSTTACGVVRNAPMASTMSQVDL